MLPDSLGRFGFNVKGGCDQVSTTATNSQHFGSGSGLDPDSESGSRRAKMTDKNRKKIINFMF
jgi:hypothetical protein